MDFNKNTKANYSRVMSRVFNRSRTSLKSSSNVTRHEVPSSVRVGAKPSVSAASSSVFSELPTVLNDYVPEVRVEKVVKRPLVKPRKTLQSLDPGKAKSPARPSPARGRGNVSDIRARSSVPAVLSSNGDEWSASHVRQCYSSRSHTRLKELKDEIKAFRQTDKLLKIRSHLYKSCGVVLDDVGNVAQDKAVQAVPEPEKEIMSSRTERREDAGAPVPDQQMRPGPQYPVDRYLVERSKIEMVNIIDDDIWKPEPALRLEEELILRKLHEMLQSTADDLKLLSGELAQREPGMRERPRAPPAPLDDDFNEKIHIEEVVNAKFNGYKTIDNPPKQKLTEKINKNDKNALNNNILQNAPINKIPTRTKQLTKSRTRIVQIDATDSTKQVEGDVVKKPHKEAVIYNEYTFQYPKVKENSFVKDLQVQTMPSINIRGELKEQKVLQLDIEPETEKTKSNSEPKYNVGVISVQHEISSVKVPASKIPPTIISSHVPTMRNIKPTRKVTKIVTSESSTSTNNGNSGSQCNLNLYTRKTTRASSTTSIRSDQNKKGSLITKTEPPKRAHLNLDEWRKKLNSVYGVPSSSKKNKFIPKLKGTGKKMSPKKSNLQPSNLSKPQPKLLNNAQYIPYSKLTLGGVNVSDIEREISDIPDKNNIPLSPIIDKIISSQDNSCNNSPRKKDKGDSSKILTTSDENLLQEVIDIEKTVNKTLSKNTEMRIKDNKSQKLSSDSTIEDTNEPDSYADDFEEEKSDQSDKNSRGSQLSSDNKYSKKANISEITDNSVAEEEKLENPKTKTNIHNVTYSKTPKLSLKKRVDVFEFVHNIDTEDTATQSQTTKKISLKETQTSPRNGSPNIKPIHNDLWPSMDPSKEIEKMFKLEKELIKKLIVDEYGDFLQSSIDKPSTSKPHQDSLTVSLNVNAAQKVTQTSPKHAKSVMTSPTRTKTRTTSPFLLSLPVDHQTSPIISVTNEKDVKVEIEQEPGDLGISINLSSPRFSLRLPNTSVEVLSNLEICSRSAHSAERKRESSARISKTVKQNITNSTSIDADNSSSEISSLGEVKLKLKKKVRRRVSSPESSSSLSSILSVDINSLGILPLRSEGELSSIHRSKSRSANLPSKSEGEISFGK
ncbi:uncharacterized protein LOC125235089 [Leguminivora glycinivorella]|uniref:uncharacterized protein LOC125235089 n=1 Tax=Leguminivora glycinivorella TaxID=1035111 RepID=UPI00200FC43C|nr:uncharacterized protein LOC125235089 [Leguminivora glycinivorella]